VPKYFDQRIVTFGIEVTSESIPDLEQKMDIIKRLFGSRVQKPLTHVYCEGERTALAEVLNPLGVTRDPDPLVAKIVVDFVLAEPFFRGYYKTYYPTRLDYAGSTVWLDFPNSLVAGDRIRITGVNAGFGVTGVDGDAVCTGGSNPVTVECIVTGTPAGAAPPITATAGIVYSFFEDYFDISTSPHVIHNPGTAEDRKAVITFNGDFDTPILTNLTNGVILEYAAVISGGDNLVVDCGAYTAVYNLTLNVIGQIVHSGDSAFMVLVPGDNMF
jgi:hypothetical protein